MATVAQAGDTANPASGLRGAPRVIDAAVRVLARDGLDGLSVRRVATEAGVSIGAVQHHYATKDALLVAAADHVTNQFKARADDLTRRTLAEEGPVAAFFAFCQLLANAAPSPDPKTETEAEDTAASIVWLWYAAKATQRGAVADAFTAGWSQTEHYLRGLIAELFPHRDAAEEAGYLLAVLDGLAVARAAEPDRMPAERASSIIRRHLAHVAATSPTWPPPDSPQAIDPATAVHRRST